MKKLFIADGLAILSDDGDAPLWSSDAEDSADFREQFGDVIVCSDFDDLVDWLGDEGYIEEGDEVESEFGPNEVEEYDEDEDDDEEEVTGDEDETADETGGG